MLKIPFIAASIASLLLAGCGPYLAGYRNTNYGSGGTQQEFDRDKYQCDLENTYQTGMLGTGINQEMSWRCMAVIYKALKKMIWRRASWMPLMFGTFASRRWYDDICNYNSGQADSRSSQGCFPCLSRRTALRLMPALDTSAACISVGYA